MLKRLHIKNLAIMDELDLEFAPGFTALTGETGAGKSILIDAIGLITGTRADATLVRHGEDRAEINAELSLPAQSAAARWLQDNEMQDADDPALCLLRRIVFNEGRTRAFVNGSAVNAGQLRELGELLIEIFGQSESQTLLRPPVQRELLDSYGAYDAQRQAVAVAADQHAKLLRELERLREAGPADPARLDYLRFQLQELQALNLEDGEIERLEAEHRKLANAGRLLQDGGSAQERLYGGDNSLYDQLASVQTQIALLVPLHEGFSEAATLAESAQAQLREAASSLRRQLERLDLDPEQLAQLDRRMAEIHDLARKHRIKAAELPERSASLYRELAEMENASGRIEALERQLAAALKIYQAAAAVLSKERQMAARRFEVAVTELVRGLGMPNAQLRVALEATGSELPRRYGADDIRFDFSANPGQPPRPLSKVASGGELSRISLALQVVTRATDSAGCMIFDEVDAGIGGGVAQIVGQTLRKLGDQRQVLCVTHQAQVAAQAHQQFAIRKDVVKGQTFTRVSGLDDKARVEELARMQGGIEVSGAALSHARELLKRAKSS